MNTKEKIEMLEEMLEADEGSLHENMKLSDISEWDSVTALTLIVMLDEHFNKSITGIEIKNLKTIGDIMILMEKQNGI